MKKMYIFSLGGIVECVDENGTVYSSSSMHGFTDTSLATQSEYLCRTFKEKVRMYENDCTITTILTEEDKNELFNIFYLVIYQTEKIYGKDHSDVAYWKRWQSQIHTNAFDQYNKQIWEKINVNDPAS